MFQYDEKTFYPPTSEKAPILTHHNIKYRAYESKPPKNLLQGINNKIPGKPSYIPDSSFKPPPPIKVSAPPQPIQKSTIIMQPKPKPEAIKATYFYQSSPSSNTKSLEDSSVQEEIIEKRTLEFIALDFSSQRYEIQQENEQPITACSVKSILKQKYPGSLSRAFEIISPYDDASILSDEMVLDNYKNPNAQFDLPYILYFMPTFPFSSFSPLNRDINERNYHRRKGDNRTLQVRSNKNQAESLKTFSGGSKR